MAPAKLQSLLQNAIVHHRAGRFREAETIYRQVRAVAPKNFDALHLSGLAALQQSRLTEAVDLLQRAVRINPKSTDCTMRLGLALLHSGRKKEAEVHLRNALQLNPKLNEAWDNLAFLLKAQDRLTEAIACHEKAVALQPNEPRVWYNYGLTLSLLGRYADALKCHERAAVADPNYALARFGRAQALHQSNYIAAAVEGYRDFLRLRPEYHEARSYLLFALHSVSGVSREELFAEHVAFGQNLGAVPVVTLPNPPDSERRLRVAVLSPDLRAHSCAYFIEPLLQQLDRDAFELYLYHDHFREDAISARLKQLAAVWRNFVGQQATVVEATIRADAPDILIDLAGHTGLSNRLPLYARRLAPVQITYLGYPDTTGVPAMDYRFTDAFADPEGEADRFATEKLVRFAPTAWAYQAPLDAPEPRIPPREAPDTLTFGCFNSPTKITDEVLTVWGRVLMAVAGSRLLLKGSGFGSADVRVKYQERMSRLGVPVERVELIDRTPDTLSHLSVYHRVDVSLDTFPYHGTTTTCEALWMGVPVVTLAGDRHMSRVGVSLLHAAGHAEWIADTTDDYVRIAADLAANESLRAALRSGLRDDLRRGPLLDHKGQADRFGAALRECWKAWCSSGAGVA